MTINQFDDRRHPDAPVPHAAPIDHARVDDLARAIESGRYTIDPDRIAEKLIEGGFPHDVNPS